MPRASRDRTVRAFLARRPAVTAAVVTVGVAATAVATYAAGGTKSAVPQLANLFVVVAALALGPIAGTVAGLGAGVALGPFMPLDVQVQASQSTQGWLVRAAVFMAVGMVTGLLARGLREADLVFQDALEAVPAPVVAASGIHPGATVTFANARARRLLGDVVGRSLEDAARSLQARTRDGRPLADVLRDTSSAHADLDRILTQVTLVDATGRQRHLRLRTLRNTTGQTMAALEDLTEEVRIARARRHLVTLAGHHLRTPLTPVVGLAPLIARHAAAHGDEILGEYAGVLQRSADRVHHVVARLTALADLEVAPVHAYERVSVTSLVDDATRRVGDADARARTESGLVAFAGDDLHVDVVPHHVVEALVELLTNALRHGEPPIVLDTATPDAGHVDLRVRDGGAGLPPTVAPEDVFLPFASMADDPGLDAPRGHGLGLALARAHCEATHGRLSYLPPNQFCIRVHAAPPRDG